MHAFDKDEEAVKICGQRFAGNDGINISQACFSEFSYPKSNLVLAHSSLFFCPEPEFSNVWSKIIESLESGGVLCVDLLGVEDSWVHSPEHSVTAFTTEQARQLFDGLNVIVFNERSEPGKTAIGHSKYWHIFSVIAVKPSIVTHD